MPDSLKGREKKVVVDNLSSEQAELIGIELGKKLGEIAKEVQERMNSLTKIYGIEAKLTYQLVDLKTGNILT